MIMFNNSCLLMRYATIILLPLLCVSCQDPDKDAKGLKEGVDALMACQQALAGDHFDAALLPAKIWRAERDGKIETSAAISEGYVTKENYRLLRFYHAKDPAGNHSCSARVSFATLPGQALLLSALNTKIGQKPSRVEERNGDGDVFASKDTKITKYSWNLARYTVELHQQSNLGSHLSLIVPNSGKKPADNAKYPVT